MKRHTVEVTARWESHHEFEFDTEAEAERFRERADGGGGEALDAIIEAGDVTSEGAELVDWRVRA